MTVTAGRCGATVHGCNDADEHDELVHAVGSAHRHKHVLGQVTDVVPHTVVGIQECLHTLPRVLGRVRMSPSMSINETDRAVRFKIPVRRPALTAHHTASN